MLAGKASWGRGGSKGEVEGGGWRRRPRGRRDREKRRRGILPTFALWSSHFSTQALGQTVVKFFLKNWHGSYSSPCQDFFFHCPGFISTRFDIC